MMQLALIVLSCLLGLRLAWIVFRQTHARRRRRRQMEMQLRLEAAFQSYYPWVLRVRPRPGVSYAHRGSIVPKHSLNKAQIAAIYERAPR
jgi:hypothetical protein